MLSDRFPHRLLLGPGPSPVSTRVREAMAQPVVGHLDPWFLSQLDELSQLLRETFRTKNDLTFAVSGTGSAGMEAAIVNAVEPGDEVIVGVNGVFGERLAEIAARSGATVVRVEALRGEIVDPSRVEQALRDHPGAVAVAVVHAETSTGVQQPLEQIGSLLKGSDTLFIVDAVTSLAGVELNVDEWGIDICYSGTQKCLSVPPGLAPITFSEKAVESLRRRKTPPRSWYLDATLIGRYWGEERVYHHTAPISMIYGLIEGLRIVKEEGLEKRWARHAEVGERLHEDLVERGFELFAVEGHRLPQLTAGILPERLQGKEVRRKLLEQYGIEVGAGLGDLADKMWRIGLMGEGAKHENVDRLLEAIDELLA
jgi:alanine-glyoxylate transaminase/serine-glyoxylate transaminase/serine-pyruvate transaminase